MGEARHGSVAIAREQTEQRLDLVVPFTTPALTAAALQAANRLGAGLHVSIRLLKVQVVPYPLDPRHSPVPLEFLKDQLRHFRSALPTDCEVRLARDFESGLTGALGEQSVVLIATHKRAWRTRTERLAAFLRRAGYTAILVPEGTNKNA